ncbi:MAG: hypothetical protein ACI90V_007592 [Bacillariaceae sp.]|jgi:hypothetical protein
MFCFVSSSYFFLSSLAIGSRERLIFFSFLSRLLTRMVCLRLCLCPITRRVPIQRVFLISGLVPGTSRYHLFIFSKTHTCSNFAMIYPRVNEYLLLSTISKSERVSLPEFVCLNKISYYVSDFFNPVTLGVGS